EEIKDYMAICDELGLSALVEAHDEAEVEMAIRCGARLIGVNNRNLKDFSVDTGNSGRLRQMIPEGITFVSESGIAGPEDVAEVNAMGADALLVGEALMRAPDKKARLAELKSLI
ncbi:MAG: indole-3-glycerol-phosphate synthase TrpC, partial [Lachnospiraceae bacterium]|nr:indole-3-glycerol-phosphate synthase TrpC [Candidatus Equihabitans merdae]